MTSYFSPRAPGWHPPAFYADYKSSIKRSPKHTPLSLPSGPAEETGPAFGHGLLGQLDHNLILNYATDGAQAVGPRMIVHGRVLDDAARPVRGALVEVWQANAGGRYRHKNEGYQAVLDPNFGGCGRVITDDEGRYMFETIKPGPYPWPNGPNSWRPAHIHFSLFGHSFAQRLITQMYFEGDPLISLCPIVQSVPEAAGVGQLTARLDMEVTRPMDALAYRFDIVLRGPDQTFFENRKDGL